MAEKLLLIDGHSILNRAFYGMPDLTDSKGQHTGAVYGFLNILFKLIAEEQPDYLTVAFDVHAPTFRHEVYADYKGTRHAMPQELREQVPLMKQVLSAMGIAILEQAGLEADDILGTLAVKAEREGMEVALVSGDRDLLQIASEHIKICLPKTKGGQSTVEYYYAADVLEYYQVTPKQFIEVKALMGDSSDNVPGVPKVGEKTAISLIRSYGSVNGVYEHLSEITRKALHDNLMNYEDQARLSLFLVTIKTDCPPELDREHAALTDIYTPEAYELFSQLGFKNFLGRFTNKPEKQEDFTVQTIEEAAQAGELEARLLTGDGQRLGVYTVYDPGRLGQEPTLLGAALTCCGEHFYLRVGAEFTEEELKNFLRSLRLRANNDRVIAVASLQEQFALWKIEEEELRDGIHLEGMEDVLLEAYLLNPLKNDYQPEDVIREYLEQTETGQKELLKKQSFAEFAAEGKDNEEKLIRFACRISDGLYEAAPALREKLIQNGMWELFDRIERPVSYILYDMHRIGIRILPEELKKYGDQLTGRIEELEGSIHQAAGCEFNIASPKQLGEILFEKMGIPGGKKTKTGYSTAADILSKLAPDYPIIEEILEYRALTKLKSTYAEGLSAFIAEDSRIHTIFHQTITATGRISSTDPNLQNIPMKTELGRMIRKVFLPEEGFVFMDSDYSQIELRVLAHMSKDAELIDAYRQNEDIHRITASKVFHVPFEEVTPLQRRNAKAVNFGIVYGQTSFGLSQGLSISRKEAAEYIEQYFQTYPGVRAFLDQLVKSAGEKGYSETMYGRRRPVPELSSGNFMTRQFGERVAMNSPIQGSAADIMKIAMIRVFEELHRQKLRSRLILQIHDELLIEAHPEELEQVRRILEEGMRGAAALSVTLETDLHTGTDWYMAK